MPEPPIKIQPWVITLIISLVINLCGAIYITAAVVTRLDDLSSRVSRIERNMDAVTNITRGPVKP